MYEMSFDFFYNYFKPFFDVKDLHGLLNIDEINLEEFEEKQKNGENDNNICKLIRDDSIDEFITYITKESIDVGTDISPSKYETNPLLNNNKVSFIQYAAFFGSLNIFKYLVEAKCEIDNGIWLFAIHSNNIELINYIESVGIPILDKEQILEASIQSFHVDICNYFINKFGGFDINEVLYIISSFKYHNLMHLPNEGLNVSLRILCTNNYYYLLLECFKKMAIKIDEEFFRNDHDILMSANGTLLNFLLNQIRQVQKEDRSVVDDENERLNKAFQLIIDGKEAARNGEEAGRLGKEKERRRFEYMKICKFYDANKAGIDGIELYIDICNRKGLQIDEDNDEYIKYLKG